MPCPSRAERRTSCSWKRDPYKRSHWCLKREDRTREGYQAPELAAQWKLMRGKGKAPLSVPAVPARTANTTHHNVSSGQHGQGRCPSSERLEPGGSASVTAALHENSFDVYWEIMRTYLIFLRKREKTEIKQNIKPPCPTRPTFV